MKRLPVYVLIGLMVLSLPIIGEVIEFKDAWGKEGIHLIFENPNEVELLFSIPRLRLQDVTIDGEDMTQVSIPGVILPNDEGAPNLPGLGRWIAIPEGATPMVEILSERKEVYKGIKIAPAPNIPPDIKGSQVTYEKDPAIYNSDEYYPEKPVKLSRRMNMRGVEAVILGITPFQYNPVTEELIVYRDIKVKVSWIGGTGRFGEERLRNRFWEPILRSNLINYSSLPKIDFNDPHRYRGNGYEYVIIVPDDPDFIAWADTIKNWRTLQGIKTGVVKLSEIGGNTVSAIETFVDTAYNNWTMPPVAVLLLSDYQSSGKAYGITSQRLNHPYSTTYITDNVYADVDGTDSLPEINFARITARDAFNLDTMINKFLDYERNPPTASNFYGEPLVACGYQSDRWFQLCSEIVYGFWTNELGKSPQRQYNTGSSPSSGDPWSSNPNTYMVVDYFGESGLGYITDTIPSGIPWNSGSAAGVNHAINRGTFIVQHRDHGSEIGWSEPDYTIPDLAGLSNDMLPFVFSINCLTGRFDYATEVFTERFHRMNGGALGLIAASQISLSFVNDAYIFGLYDNMWHNFDPAYPESTMWGYEHLRPGFANCSGKYYLEASSWPYNPGDKDITFNLFHMHGDPFITLNSEVPESLDVSYIPSMQVGGQPFTVTVTEKFTGNPVDSARVAIWCVKEDSVWHRGWTNASGMITFNPNPMIVGDTMRVTVTKVNHFMHRGFARIVAGMQVTINPDTIDVNTPTDVTVTVLDTLSNPMDSIEVHIHRYGVSEYDTTNVAGICTLNVNSPYGQILIVDGRKIDESWNSFTDTIWVVGASDLTTPAIGAYSDTIGVIGGLMPDIPGTAWGSLSETNFTLYLSGCGINTSTFTTGDSVEIDITPTIPGNILGTIGKSGYNIYQDNIPVKIYNGWLSGYITDASTSDSIANARVKGYEAGADTSSVSPVFNLVSNANGLYQVSDSIPCGDYDIYTIAFGYQPDFEVVTIKQGNNVNDIALNPAPSGTVYGTVTEKGGGDSLTSLINIYRTDNGSLYTSTTTDSLAGGSYSVDLPQFSYRFVVRSYKHVPIDTIVNLNTGSLEINFVMDTTSGNILIIDDSGSKGVVLREENLKGINKEGISSESRAGAAANKFYGWLTGLGYSVDTTTTALTDTSDWNQYDFLIMSSGPNVNPLSSNNITSKLINWVNKDGKLLIEGGEVGYDWDGTSFGAQVLHITDWDSDNAGNLPKHNATHPLTTVPNTLADPLTISYSGYGDEDAVVLDSYAELIYGTTSYPSDAGILIFDPTIPIESGQIVYYAFNLDALSDTNDAKELIENTANYLLALEPPGPDTLYGHVELYDTPYDSGAIVTAKIEPLVYIDTTDEFGNYEITGLYDGIYDITASKFGFSDSVVTGVNITGNLGMNFTLYPIAILYHEDFEDSNGAYTATGDWEWGTPTSGPSGAHSGVNVWATVLSGNFSPNSDSRLTTVDINLSGATHPILSFYHWYDMGSGCWDGGNVKISVNGGAWQLLDNLDPPYNCTAGSGNAGIPGELCYGEATTGWEEVTRDFGEYVGSTITLRFHFGSTSVVEHPGWYIDDVMIYGSTAGITTGEELPSVYSMVIDGIRLGSKFNIRYSLPEKAAVVFKVYDITGREIKHIRDVKEAGFYETRIDMSNRAAGVYFIRMEANERVFTKKAVLIR